MQDKLWLVYYQLSDMRFLIVKNIYCKSADYKGTIKNILSNFWKSTSQKPIFATQFKRAVSH